MKEAENLLFSWGRWSRDHPGLLMSSKNIIGKCMDEAFGASQVSVKPEISMPAQIEKAENIVLSMPNELREVMILKYVAKKYARDACKIVHCGNSEYYNRINMGISFTAGYLQAISLLKKAIN